MMFLSRRWTCRRLHEAYRRDGWAIYVQSVSIPPFQAIKYVAPYAAGVSALVPYGNQRRKDWIEVAAWLNTSAVKVHFPSRETTSPTRSRRLERRLMRALTRKGGRA